MLNDVDERAFPEERATGIDDGATATQIESLHGVQSLLPDGPVDETTWRAVRDRICGSYDF